MEQNLYKMFTNDPVEYNMKQLRSQLGITLITLLREKGWSDEDAAVTLGVDATWVRTLLEGELEGFTVEGMLEMLVLMGYTLEATYNPGQPDKPFALEATKGIPD